MKRTERTNPLGGAILKVSIESKGFTLIEVLITLIILAVALLALAGMMVATTRNNSSGAHITEAATFAQDKMEELRATRWETILEGTNKDKVKSSTGIDYARDWNVVTNGNRKTITVAVNWSDRVNHSIRLVSVISR
jgi:prepilin-type N-terminal cleavage/methylation domain-containing protein